MKYFIFDTETSDKFDFSKPADDPCQGRLASLAAFVLNEDRRIIGAESWYVKPDGWTLSEEAASVNGLTMEFLEENGYPIEIVLESYLNHIDSGAVLASYGAQFDCKVMRGELRRAGFDDRFKQTKNVCLMRASTNICRIPRKSGGGYKWPKLQEACEFFGIRNLDSHGAIGDALAALQIFLQIYELLPEAIVHYAKDRPS